MMDTDLGFALQISLIGMGLVIAAIVVLLGIMVLLRQLSSGTQTKQDSPKPNLAHTEQKYRAAAAAVALALSEAEQNRIHHFPLPPTALVSAWQAVMRSTQLQRRRPR